MLFNDWWTQGLNDRQQKTIIDFVDNDYKIFSGIGGYRNTQYPANFLNSKKGRQALVKYGEYMTDVRREKVKDIMTRIWFTRAFYNPAEIITPDGCLVLPEGATTLKALGEYAYCIEVIETSYDRMGRKQVKIKLCDRDKAREFIEKLFRIHDLDLKDDISGNKPIHEMTDEERIQEIQELLDKHKIKALPAPEVVEKLNEE